MTDTEWMTTKEVALLLGVHPATVSGWVAQGLFDGAIKLNPARKNSHYRIPRNSVDAFKKSQVITSEKEPISET